MATVSGTALIAALDGAPTELQQAMALLRAAGHEPATMTLGEGDRILLDLVHEVAPRPLELTATCDNCGEMNAVTITPASVPPYAPRCRWIAPGVGVREPRYGDLEGLPLGEVDATDALCRRCSVGPVSRADAKAALDDIDCSLGGPVELACVECGDGIEVSVDIELLALTRLRRVSDDVDREIHLLASAYGWELATIEALPDRRRHRLAELVEAS